MRRRLQEAALELFLERGYDGTTAMDIAAQVGVTERTFFRYFPDKRDVLFDEAALHDGLTKAIGEAPADLAPIEAMHWAFAALVPLFENNRPISEPSRELIGRTPALHERYLTKAAATSQTLAAALRDRGTAHDVASLAAAVGMSAIGHAMEAWFKDPSIGLEARIDQAFNSLKTMMGRG